MLLKRSMKSPLSVCPILLSAAGFSDLEGFSVLRERILGDGINSDDDVSSPSEAREEDEETNESDLLASFRSAV